MPHLRSIQNVSIAQPPASLFARSMAAAIDLGFLASYYVLLFPFLIDHLPSTGWLAFLLFTPLLFPMLEEIFWEGRTLGKFCLGIRVVNTDGSSPQLWAYFLRGLLLWVDLFLSLGVGILLFLGTRQHRRLGDLAAGTFVVNAILKSDQRAVLEAFAEAPDDYVPRFPNIAALTPHQAALLDETLFFIQTSATHSGCTPELTELSERVERLMGHRHPEESDFHYLASVLYDYRHAL